MKESIRNIKELLALDILLASGAVAIYVPDPKPVGTAPEYNVQLECVDPRVAALFANALRTWDAVDRIEITLDGKTLISCDEGLPWVEGKPTIAEQNAQRVAFHMTAKTMELAPWARSQRSTTGVPGVGFLVKSPSGGVVIDPPSWTGVELYNTKVNVISGEVTYKGLPLIVSWNTVKAVSSSGVSWRHRTEWRSASVCPWPLGVVAALWQSRDTLGVAWEKIPFSMSEYPPLPMAVSYLASRLFEGVKRGNPGERPFELGLSNLWISPSSNDASPGRWGLNRFRSTTSSRANAWGVAQDLDKLALNVGRRAPNLNRASFDWTSCLCLMGTRAIQNGTEVSLSEAMRSEPRLLTGSSPTPALYGVTHQIHEAIQTFVALYVGDAALGTTEIRRVS